MSTRFKLRPRDHLGHSASKQTFNRALFTEVAPKYDFITKALSLGRDGAWKRHLVANLPEALAPVCVDLACGTGDITRLLAARYPGGRVAGLDLTPSMIEIARAQTPEPNVEYIEGTLHELPLKDASVDIVTGGYALRNAPDLGQALDEIHRVLQIGGTAAFLDFSKPPSRLGQRLSHIALKTWGGLWGLLLHGNPDVYGYIADSLSQFPDRKALREEFNTRGFALRQSRLYYGGLLQLLVFEKRGHEISHDDPSHHSDNHQ